MACSKYEHLDHFRVQTLRDHCDSWYFQTLCHPQSAPCNALYINCINVITNIQLLSDIPNTSIPGIGESPEPLVSIFLLTEEAALRFARYLFLISPKRELPNLDFRSTLSFFCSIAIFDCNRTRRRATSGREACFCSPSEEDEPSPDDDILLR